jgi:hypothetical protein
VGWQKDCSGLEPDASQALFNRSLMLAAHRNNPFTSLASNCLSGAIFHLFPFLRVAPQKDRAGFEPAYGLQDAIVYP